MPDYLDSRYTDYGRTNASIGINGTVLTNVNPNAWVLTPQNIRKVSALADVFSPYGIKVYLTARFSASIEIGGLETADPLDPGVRKWWKDACLLYFQTFSRMDFSEAIEKPEGNLEEYRSREFPYTPEI